MQEEAKIDIEFKNVVKKYSKCINDLQRLISLIFPFKKYGTITILDDISFKIYEGEKVALIGKNGCGKSTTLKIISKITIPNSGTVIVNRSVSNLLEVTAGFSPEFSGRENILTRATLLGIKKKEVKKMERAIFEYAEIPEHFWDQQIKRYSSGMVAKLGVAICLLFKPDILIVDEALAVGDVSFIKKVQRTIVEMSKSDKFTMIFVSHSQQLVQDLCTKGIYICKGKIKYIGDVKTAIKIYNEDLELEQKEIENQDNESNYLLSEDNKTTDIK